MACIDGNFTVDQSIKSGMLGALFVACEISGRDDAAAASPARKPLVRGRQSPRRIRAMEGGRDASCARQPK